MEQTNGWKCVKSEKGPDLKLFGVRWDYMLNPRNQKTERMVILESNDSVNVVALTPQQEILFVRQYRFGIGAETLELPGGIVDEGEEHGVAAQRELQEETGYSGIHWQVLGKVGSNPVFMNSWIHHWQADNVQLTHHLSLDDGELINLVKLPIAEVKEKFFQGFFQHPHTVNALLLFFGNARPSRVDNP